MAVNSSFNWLGQQRVDVPHLRMLESGVRYDFDAMAYILVGETPQIVKGFELAVGSPGVEARTIAFRVAGSKVIHPLASESGSVFSVPTTRPLEVLNSSNSRIEGTWAANATNYVSVDLRRSADSTTSDFVQFLNPSTNTEAGQKVPLRRTLDYVFVIRQTDFSFDRSLCPLIIVRTNSQNVIETIRDARPLMGRLAPGGSYVNDVVTYGWPGGRPNIESAVTSPIAGDKAIASMKDWQRAVMHRLHELGGGQYWYSLAADRNVGLRTGASTFVSTGESFEVVANNVHWQGISFSFDNSPRHAIAVADQLTSSAGLTDLADGECVYADLDRTATGPIYLQKGALSSLGGSSRPGQRWVVCSRIGNNFYVSGQPWPIGTSFKLATTTVSGILKTNIDEDPVNPIAATVISTPGNRIGSVTGAGLSHNLDVGTAHAYVASGDIRIGEGQAAGDNSVIIKTDQATKGTIVLGAGTSVPYLTVNHTSNAPTPTDQAISFNQGVVYLEGNRAWVQKAIAYLPLPPQQTFAKMFVKSDKTWKDPVRVMTRELFFTTTYTYDNVGKTLTKTTLGPPVADSVSLNLNDRLLVNYPGFAGNGLYCVSSVGVIEPFAPAILTKTIDGGGPGSVEFLNKGFDIFDGVTIPILEGTYQGQFAILDAPLIAEAVDLSAYEFNPADDAWTRDQVCNMWTDGSYTIVSTSPAAYEGFTFPT